MAKLDNKIIRAQEIIFNQLERLDDNDIMKSGYGKRELERSTVISNGAQALIKVVSLQLKLKEVAQRNKIKETKLLQELNIIGDKHEKKDK